MIQRHQRERAKAPEHERVREPGQRPFANDLGLAEHLPQEVSQARRKRGEAETRVGLRTHDVAVDDAEALPEEESGNRKQREKERYLKPGMCSHAAGLATQDCSMRESCAGVRRFVLVGMECDAALVLLDGVVDDGADRRASEDRGHARAESELGGTGVRKVPAGARPRLVDDAEVVVEEDARIARLPQQAFVVDGIHFGVLLPDLSRGNAQVAGDVVDLVAGHVDARHAATVGALRAIDLLLDFAGSFVEAVVLRGVVMKIAPEFEVFALLFRREQPDLDEIREHGPSIHPPKLLIRLVTA